MKAIKDIDDDMARQLQAIITATDQHIRTLQALGLSGTAKLFAIAKLDLMMNMHGISEQEFRAFCEALEQGAATARKAEVIDLASKVGKR